MIKILIIIMIVMVVLTYLVGAVITYGVEFAYWQKIVPDFADEDYKEDLRLSIVEGILWPFMLLDFNARANFIRSYKKYGTKFK